MLVLIYNELILTFSISLNNKIGPGPHSGGHCGQHASDYSDPENIDSSKCNGFIADVFGDSGVL